MVVATANSRSHGAGEASRDARSSAHFPPAEVSRRELGGRAGRRRPPLAVEVAWFIPGVAGSWDVCAPE